MICNDIVVNTNICTLKGTAEQQQLVSGCDLLTILTETI